MTLSAPSREPIVHRIIQSREGIRILGSQSIDYAPGILIGIPRNYVIENLNLILSEVVEDARIVFYEFAIKSYKRSVRGYVLFSYFIQDGSAVFVTTILIPNRIHSYRLAETDIVLISHYDDCNCEFKSNRGVRSTQEIIFQPFEQNLTGHYDNLGKVMGELISRYRSSDDPINQNIATSYSMLNDLILKLEGLIKSHLKEYDRKILYSTGFVSVRVNPLVNGYCDKKSLRTCSGGECDEYTTTNVCIWGTFTSYVPYSGGNGVSFYGSSTIDFSVTTSGRASVWMPQGSSIAYASIRKTRGIGYAYVSKAGNLAQFTMVGLGAGFEITVVTNSFASGSQWGTVRLATDDPCSLGSSRSTTIRLCGG